MYKKEVKLGDIVNCKYAFEDGKHIIVIESSDAKVVHCIVQLF